MLMVNMSISENKEVGNLPIVCDFPEVFLKEINDLSPKGKVEFVIELVLGTSTISMALYHMSPSKLKELKNQLEDLLEKRLIRPSV